MKKFISIITTFILSITLLSAPVQARVNETELLETLELNQLTPVETINSYEYDIIEVFENTMEDFEIILVSSDFQEDVYIYVVVPKYNYLLYIAEDAYRGDIESMQLWDEFTDELRESSVLIQKRASQVTGSKYAVMILHPEEYEYLLWMGFDGEVAYDYVNGISDVDVLLD